MILLTQEFEDAEPLAISLRFFILLFLGIAWLTLLPAVIIGYLYFTFFPFTFTLLNILLLIPLFFLLFGITLLNSALITKIGLWIVHKRICYPEVGVYPLSMDIPQTRAFIIKGNLKGFGGWLFTFFPVWFLRAFWLRLCGVKLGKNVKLSKYVQNEDFIEIGDNTFLSKYCIISGHLIHQNVLTLNKTVIGKNVIMQHFSGSVGGEVGDNSIFLDRATGAMKGQVCLGNAIYYGVPCKKIADNDLSPEQIKALKENILTVDKINFIKQKNAPIKTSTVKMGLMKMAIIGGGIALGTIIPLLYSLFFSALYNPSNPLLTFALLALIPFIFLITIVFFILGTTLVIKLFISSYDKKAEIPEGIYDLDDPRAKYFKIKYFLRRFGLQLIAKMPFTIAETFLMRFWGNVKIGRNVIVVNAIIDPQYIEIGDNVIIAAGARLHTHDIIDGKLYIKKVIIGRNTLVGAFCHIKPGVEIADGSIIAVGAWMRKNRKCKRPALWVGKPAFELPLEVITQTTGSTTKKIVDEKFDKKQSQTSL